MSIRRVVPNIQSKTLEASRAFYVDLLGFKVAMDMGFIVTLVSPRNPTAQISLLREAEKSDTPYAHLSIEVLDVDEIHGRAVERDLKIIYPLTDEPWGVRRFCVADPNGTVLNIMSHISERNSTPQYELAGNLVGIRRPEVADCDEFIAVMQASGDFHRGWVDPPATRERYMEYLNTRRGPTDDGFLICDRESGKIAGVINISCIVRGAFHSAFLGYYAGAEFARRGYMSEGLMLVARYAFAQIGLHRLEANIQPENIASIALVRKCGFRKEGFSPRYLKVAGEWRDHERWALIADKFRAA